MIANFWINIYTNAYMHKKEFFKSILKKVTIFAGIDEKGIDRIYSECRIVKKKAGEVIIREGSDATDIYIILKGKVQIVLSVDNRPFELLELGAGNCVGEASVIGIQKHCASVSILEDAALMVLSGKVLMDIYAEDKEVFSLLILNIARELARRLYRTDQILLKCSLHTTA